MCIRFILWHISIDYGDDSDDEDARFEAFESHVQQSLWGDQGEMLNEDPTSDLAKFDKMNFLLREQAWGY